MEAGNPNAAAGSDDPVCKPRTITDYTNVGSLVDLGIIASDKPRLILAEVGGRSPEPRMGKSTTRACPDRDLFTNQIEPP